MFAHVQTWEHIDTTTLDCISLDDSKETVTYKHIWTDAQMKSQIVAVYTGPAHTSSKQMKTQY